MSEPFTCPRCGAVSHHPRDHAECYCGRCHDWTREAPARTLHERALDDAAREVILERWRHPK
jgi:hypothetical protein